MSALFNKQHTVYDPWDGYIDFTFDTFDPANPTPFEPVVGDTVKDTVTGATAVVSFLIKDNSTL